MFLVALNLVFHLFNHSFVHSFIHSLARSFFPSFLRTRVYACVRTCVRPFAHSLFRSFIFFFSKGQVLPYNTIRDVIKFCAREKLVLFADEVYQETLFTNEAQFHSCKKVLRDLGPEYSKFQLMSIHSVSKGIYGE